MILFMLGLAFCWLAASVFTLVLFRKMVERNNRRVYEHADH
jgi:hypothetical protein